MTYSEEINKLVKEINYSEIKLCTDYGFEATQCIICGKRIRLFDRVKRFIMAFPLNFFKEGVKLTCSGKCWNKLCLIKFRKRINYILHN